MSKNSIEQKDKMFHISINMRQLRQEISARFSYSKTVMSRFAESLRRSDSQAVNHPSWSHQKTKCLRTQLRRGKLFWLIITSSEHLRLHWAVTNHFKWLYQEIECLRTSLSRKTRHFNFQPIWRNHNDKYLDLRKLRRDLTNLYKKLVMGIPSEIGQSEEKVIPRPILERATLGNQEINLSKITYQRYVVPRYWGRSNRDRYHDKAAS